MPGDSPNTPTPLPTQERSDSARFTAIYQELRRLAHAKMRHERAGSLHTTALVHEAYLRLAGGAAERSEDRAYFFASAGEAMRRILVEQARRRTTAKRGDGWQRAPLDEVAARAPDEELLALDAALHRLRALDARKCRVVELRYFAGLTVEQAAHALGVSPRTVNNDWNLARAWLHRAIRGDDDSP